MLFGTGVPKFPHMSDDPPAGFSVRELVALEAGGTAIEVVRLAGRPAPSEAASDADRALVDLALRLGGLNQRDAILRAGAVTLGTALSLPAAWSTVAGPSRRTTARGGAGPAEPLIHTDHERFRAHFPELAARLPVAGHHAWIVLPLAVEAEPAGALGVAWTASQPADDETRRVLEIVARLVSQRLRLMEARAREHELAQRLQLSLLPTITAIEGLEIEYRYHPAGAGALAGGDFYDVVDLGAGMTAVVIGDVAGHGVDAAAASGEVRYLTRGMLEHTCDPARVIQLVDTALGRGGRPTTMVTLLCALIRADHDELQMASAGHCPPLLRRAGGAVELAAMQPAPPLGAGLVSAAAGPETTTLPFLAGDLAVFYTDGLVERRSTPIDEMVEAVRAITAEHGSPPVLCSHLEALAGGARGQGDDVALLVVRRESGADCTKAGADLARAGRSPQLVRADSKRV